MMEKLNLDTSKASFRKIIEKIDSAHRLIDAATFDELSQEERLLVLRRFLGMLLNLNGKNIRCISADHEDRHPSMGFCDETGGFHCFGCGMTCDVFDVIGAEKGIDDFKKQYAYVVHQFVTSGIDRVYEYKPAPQLRLTASNEDSTKARRNKHYVPLENCGFTDSYGRDLGRWYFEEVRGLPLDFVCKYGVRGWAYAHEIETDSGQKVPVKDYYIVFLNDAGGESRRWVYREPEGYGEPRFKWWNKKGTLGVFNGKALDNARGPVFVCESAIDALSVLRLTNASAIGLNGVENFSKIKTSKKKLILMFDNDAAGRVDASKYGYRFFVPDFLRPNYQGDSAFARHKDVNDALIAEPDATRESLWGIYADARTFYENGGGYCGWN